MYNDLFYPIEDFVKDMKAALDFYQSVSFNKAVGSKEEWLKLFLKWYEEISKMSLSYRRFFSGNYL